MVVREWSLAFLFGILFARLLGLLLERKLFLCRCFGPGDICVMFGIDFTFLQLLFIRCTRQHPSHVLLDACDFQYSVGWDVAWVQTLKRRSAVNCRSHTVHAMSYHCQWQDTRWQCCLGHTACLKSIDREHNWLIGAECMNCDLPSSINNFHKDRSGSSVVCANCLIFSHRPDSCTHWLNRNLHNDGCSGSIVCADRNRLDLPAQQTATTMPFSLAGCIFFLVNVVSCQSNRLTFHLQHIICLLYIAFDTFTAPMFLQCLCNRCTINSYDDDDGDQQ